MAVNGNYGADPNYPSPLRPNTYRDVEVNQVHETWVGKAVHNLQPVTPEDYVQAGWLWQVLGRTKGQQENLVYNISSHLFAAIKEVRERTYEMFEKVDKDLGRRVRESTEDRRSKADTEEETSIIGK